MEYMVPEPENYDTVKVNHSSSIKNVEVKGPKKKYHWRTNHWGTELEPKCDVTRIRDWKLLISFQAAGEPPIEALLAFKKEHPDVEMRIQFYEPTTSLCGCEVI